MMNNRGESSATLRLGRMGTGAIKSPPEGARQIDAYRRLVSGPLFVETVFTSTVTYRFS